MIKAVVFDIGGVLFQPGMLYGLFKDLSKKHDVDLQLIRTVFSENWNLSKIGKLSEMQMWKNIINKTELPYAVEEFAQLVYDFFQPDKEVFEIAKSLKGKYVLGILSNTVENWFEYQSRKQNFSDLFEVIVTSCESGLAKPDVEIYAHLAQKLSLEPEEIFFIDDQIRNVVVAKGFGIRAYVFESVERLKLAFKEEGVLL